MRLFNRINAYWSKELKRYVFAKSSFDEYEGPVAYAFGGGGGSSEVVPTGPFGPQIPFIERLFAEAGGLLNQGPPQFPGFPTVASPGQDLINSQGGIADFVAGQAPTNLDSINVAADAARTAGTNPVSETARQLQPDLISGIMQLLNSGNNQLTQQSQQTLPGATGAINAATGGVQGPPAGINLSGGPTLPGAGVNINPTLEANLSGSGLNPFIGDTVDAATRQLVNNFQRNVLPSIGDAASFAGQVGGTRQGIAEGIASGDFLNSVGDVTSQLFSQGFNRNVDVQQNALSQVGQAQGQQGQLELGTGAINEQINNSALTQALVGAGLAQQGAGQGIGLGQSGVATGTAQSGNLLQAGNAQSLQQLFSALGILPSLQANELSQLGALNQSGLQQLGLDQSQIDAQTNEFFFNQNAPFNALAQFQNFIGGAFGGSVGGSEDNLNFPGLGQTQPEDLTLSGLLESGKGTPPPPGGPSGPPPSIPGGGPGFPGAPPFNFPPPGTIPPFNGLPITPPLTGFPGGPPGPQTPPGTPTVPPFQPPGTIPESGKALPAPPANQPPGTIPFQPPLPPAIKGAPVVQVPPTRQVTEFLPPNF